MTLDGDHVYRATFVKLIDYDTFWAEIKVPIDCTFEKRDSVMKVRKVRLARVNSNEVRVKIEEAEEGYANALQHGIIFLSNVRGGKYQERVIAEATVWLPGKEGVNLSDYLLEAGLATPWRG